MTPTDIDWQLTSYNFALPQHLLAQKALDDRAESKLLVYDCQTDSVRHEQFKNIMTYLPEDSALAFNTSKVFKARVPMLKETGGTAELFLLNLNKPPFYCLIKTHSKKKDQFCLKTVDGAYTFKIQKASEEDGLFIIDFGDKNISMTDFMNTYGKVPLPPYIKREKEDLKDIERYQTVYANRLGSVAAPTAGLHFSKDLLEEVKSKYVCINLDLQVGIGTFKPVTAENILKHQMHGESVCVDQQNQLKIKQNWGNIIAVGTTSLRSLESFAGESGQFDFKDESFETRLFLYPGKKVHSCKGLITNFHLPKSSLLMLVSAFIGREKMLELYKVAIEKEYRFYSYGDAMLLLK